MNVIKKRSEMSHKGNIVVKISLTVLVFSSVQQNFGQNTFLPKTLWAEIYAGPAQIDYPIFSVDKHWAFKGFEVWIPHGANISVTDRNRYLFTLTGVWDNIIYSQNGTTLKELLI